MRTTAQIAKHIHQMYFGDNWTEVNLKDTLSNISFKVANKHINGFNSILALTYHIHYFTKAQLKVLEHGILDAKDSESYKHPEITSQLEWETFLNIIWEEAKQFSALIKQLPNNILQTAFVDEKYGTYATNFLGLIEHTHYHLGQIVILKKLVYLSKSHD